MSKATKFGTFAGVYTPSLLTILGVIMYMRLGWVVGQSGLFSALVIILLAHVISISTGLSISSIATDKKIKTGGIYYILSRSLGLPMGGAIGISIFVGTALSISLYLIGFAESFLSIDAIREFTGLQQDINSFRIVGTAAILLLVLIAFISTSLAIKTQFYILGAIALSLISIVIGFVTKTEFAPVEPSLTPIKDSLSPELIFAIFFPAVTGFTAGVAMSGDLKDSKKAIPLGTLASIGTGLLVYVGLAVGFAFFIKRDLLLNDYNFLLQIAWFSPFVIAGIWGATLSSALGGILGGPRILQAISSDRILPKIFAKGYGKNNEPRNALFLVFLIAEAGILIGELNVIAGIVTMFYLASYGFINFAFFLESWASTDFRPSFKINRYVGLIGFIAAFGVMFKLDMMSMFAALIIIIILYFLLKRKQLTNDFGDVWQSVYSSLVRTALHKMDQRNLEQRNWQPNIILFSGGSKKRPHLLSFGKNIVGKHGVMSNFDLIENKNAQILFAKSKQSIAEGDNNKGIFTRKKTVKNIYDGIETISSIYGFSGFEPNTVLMGWGRQTQNPVRFVEMLNKLYDLDLNVLLLDYDKRMGFGSFKSIDIWWKDVSNQGNLALTLVKFMLQSVDWQNATVRLMIVNTKNDQRQSIISRAEKLLDNMRITATVKVINNQFEQKTLHTIILEESIKTDLVILAIPPILDGKEEEFVEETNKLLHKAGTVLMIRASSNFKRHSLGSESSRITYLADKVESQDIKLFENIEIELPKIENLDEEFAKLNNHVTKFFDDFNKNFILPALKFNQSKTLLLRQNFADAITNLEEESFWNIPNSKQKMQLISIKTSQIFRSEKLMEELQKTIIEEQKDLLSNGLNHLLTELDQLPDLFSQKITAKVKKVNLEVSELDSRKSAFKKRIIRSFSSKNKLENGIEYSISFRKAIKRSFSKQVLHHLYSSLNGMGNINLSYIIELQKLTVVINNFFETLENPNSNIEIVKTAKSGVNAYFDKLDNLIRQSQEKLVIDLFYKVYGDLNELSKHISTLNIPPKTKKTKQESIKSLRKKILITPDHWTNNRYYLYNGAILELKLMVIRYRLHNLLQKSISEIKQYAEEQIVKKQSKLSKLLSNYIKDLKSNNKVELKISDNELNFNDKEEIQLLLNKITDNAFKNAKSIVGRLPASTEIIATESLKEAANIMDEELKTVSISTYQLVDFYVQQNLIEPLLKHTKSLPDKIQASNNKIKDALRLVSIGNLNAGFELNTEIYYDQDTDLMANKESFIAFANEQLKIIRKESTAMENLINEVQFQLDNQLKLAAEDLSIYQLLSTPEKYKSYLSKREKKSVSSIINNQFSKLSESFQTLKANLWYRQSDALIFARKLGRQNNEPTSLIDSILTIRDLIAPNETTLNKIPFYYRQLFLQKQNYQREFWFNRSKELKDLEKTLKRYNNAYLGAILIRGDRKSGKTFLTNYLSNTLLKDNNVYHINSSAIGSSDTYVFHAALENATQIKGSYSDIFGRISAKSVIVIDDLELWWEKTDKGTEVIQLIKELIQQYNGKCLFVISTYNKSYNLINQIVELDSSFLSIIDLSEFNAIGLQDAIMFRHKSSGLEVSLAGRPNFKLNNTKMARLFAKYFNYTQGNIGLALLAWIANIVDVQENKILIKQPSVPDFSVFRSVNPQIKVYLTLILLHNRVNIEKLARLTQDQEDVVRENISFLKRAGLIKEYTGPIYEIDPYFHPFLTQVFFEKNDTIN